MDSIFRDNLAGFDESSFSHSQKLDACKTWRNVTERFVSVCQKTIIAKLYKEMAQHVFTNTRFPKTEISKSTASLLG
jgi:hypothetical protein